MSIASLIALNFAHAQTVGPKGGALILSGAGEAHGDSAVLHRFVQRAGGVNAEIVYIPTAASSIRLPSGLIFDLPESGRITPPQDSLERQLAKLFGVRRVRILHTRDAAVAASPSFAQPLTSARAVWIGYGNAGRLTSLLLGTPLARELARVLERGGVVGGNSAGAIVQGSFILRGLPGKPALIARGHEKGFALLRGTVINPHLTSAHREDELVSVIDQHPDLLGIGLEDGAGLLVVGDTAEVLGSARAAIYDDTKHGSLWYYWLQPGDRFNLATRKAISTDRAR